MIKQPKPKKCKWSLCGKTFVPQRPLQQVCNYVCAVGYAHQKQAEKEKKELDNVVKVMRIDTHAKEYKKALQDEINKLARRIDLQYGYVSCIDCSKPYGMQQDGAHFNAVGSNNSVRYHLDNIHSASSHCNQYSDSHKQNYEKGLIKRYGPEYLEKVKGLPLKYNHIKLTNGEVVEKLKIVRHILRTLHTYKFESSLDARDYFNKIIGIYN